MTYLNYIGNLSQKKNIYIYIYILNINDNILYN
jgi:hypothetical protein